MSLDDWALPEWVICWTDNQVHSNTTVVYFETGMGDSVMTTWVCSFVSFSPLAIEIDLL